MIGVQENKSVYKGIMRKLIYSIDKIIGIETNNMTSRFSGVS